PASADRPGAHGPRKRPNRKEATNSTRKMMNRILAIPVAVPAMPPKPSTPAMMAMIRKVMAQLSMACPSYGRRQNTQLGDCPTGKGRGGGAWWVPDEWTTGTVPGVVG